MDTNNGYSICSTVGSLFSPLGKLADRAIYFADVFLYVLYF